MFQGTVIQTSQGLQIQGVKRPVLSSPSMGTKKVIIATINGKQRILTPVSSPQIIAMKSSSPRYYSDGTVLNGSGPILIQKPVTTINKPKQLNSPVMNSRTTDNKTCLWKFENGQVNIWKYIISRWNITVNTKLRIIFLTVKQVRAKLLFPFLYLEKYAYDWSQCKKTRIYI